MYLGVKRNSLYFLFAVAIVSLGDQGVGGHGAGHGGAGQLPTGHGGHGIGHGGGHGGK